MQMWPAAMIFFFILSSPVSFPRALPTVLFQYCSSNKAAGRQDFLNLLSCLPAIGSLKALGRPASWKLRSCLLGTLLKWQASRLASWKPRSRLPETLVSVASRQTGKLETTILSAHKVLPTILRADWASQTYFPVCPQGSSNNSSGRLAFLNSLSCLP